MREPNESDKTMARVEWGRLVAVAEIADVVRDVEVTGIAVAGVSKSVR